MGPTMISPCYNDSFVAPLSIHRSHFPDSFVFGAATAAYQVEGAASEGGRKPSIWDTFSHTPGKISDGTNGDVACDQYHKYQEDIDLMARLNLNAYRFSISWSRIFPEGTGPEPNKEGIAYYNKVIDGLLQKGITPYVTLYHWDLPQVLQDSFGGWTDRKIVKAYVDYAEACFAAFGNRVKHWITFNEPVQFSYNGYGTGIHAPGRCSNREMCPEGNSAVEPYLAAHHVLLAHAATMDLFRRFFKAKQGGVLGIALDCEWGEPLTNSPEDQAAAQRHVLFQLGWFLDPIYFGDYPAVMRENVGNRLPHFSEDEILLLRGCLDFIGINHYTSRYTTSGPTPLDPQQSHHFLDQCVIVSEMRNCKPIGDRAASEWLYIVPWGLQKLLTWTTERYNRPPLYITENGMDDESGEKPLEEMLQDTKRIRYYQEYLTAVLQAIREGANVQGYFAWSLLDNFEWAVGYTKRFGLIYVDYENDKKRYVKLSAKWYSGFLNKAKEGCPTI
ncbi:unnamed protein product [Sphagnum tenellum]